MSYKNWLAKIEAPKDVVNYTVTAAEVRETKEHMNGRRGVIYKHDIPNRIERRKKEEAAILNNRSNPKKRQKVHLRMAWFALSLQGKQARA